MHVETLNANSMTNVPKPKESAVKISLPTAPQGIICEQVECVAPNGKQLTTNFQGNKTLQETISISNYTFQRCTQFACWINEMNLADLEFSGSPFTWCLRGTNVNTCIHSRLDRALSNVE